MTADGGTRDCGVGIAFSNPARCSMATQLQAAQVIAGLNPVCNATETYRASHDNTRKLSLSWEDAPHAGLGRGPAKLVKTCLAERCEWQHQCDTEDQLDPAEGLPSTAGHNKLVLFR
jgi:hypothetical protein